MIFILQPSKALTLRPQALNKYWWITLSLTFGRKRPKTAVISSNDGFPVAPRITRSWDSSGHPRIVPWDPWVIATVPIFHKHNSNNTLMCVFKYILFSKCNLKNQTEENISYVTSRRAVDTHRWVSRSKLTHFCSTMGAMLLPARTSWSFDSLVQVVAVLGFYSLG